MSDLLAQSLFNGRWTINDPNSNHKEIRKALYYAWESLIKFGQTYEYVSIMRCTEHLISLFLEDYPNTPDLLEVGIVALQISYIMLSQGIKEDPTFEDFEIFFSPTINEIQLKMLSYPYHRCTALMETELLDPIDVYNQSLNLIMQQLGPNHNLNLFNLRHNIFNYYKDLQSRPFFEQEFEPYIPIGGDASFANRTPQYPIPPLPLTLRPTSRIQPDKLPVEKYPPYLNRNNNIPSI